LDKRDALTWIAIELTYLGEAKVEESTLEVTLRQDLQVGAAFPIFVPAKTYLKANKPITLHLMEGYVFVGTGLPDTTYFGLEKKPYVAQIMSSTNGPNRIRTLSTIPNSYVENLRKKLRQLAVADVGPDSEVRVSDGTYKALEGRVLGVRGDHAYVLIQLRSIEIIATVPLAFLEIL